MALAPEGDANQTTHQTSLRASDEFVEQAVESREGSARGHPEGTRTHSASHGVYHMSLSAGESRRLQREMPSLRAARDAVATGAPGSITSHGCQRCGIARQLMHQLASELGIAGG